jgi:hypothetical protein
VLTWALQINSSRHVSNSETFTHHTTRPTCQRRAWTLNMFRVCNDMNVTSPNKIWRLWNGMLPGAGLGPGRPHWVQEGPSPPAANSQGLGGYSFENAAVQTLLTLHTADSPTHTLKRPTTYLAASLSRSAFSQHQSGWGGRSGGPSSRGRSVFLCTDQSRKMKSKECTVALKVQIIRTDSH